MCEEEAAAAANATHNMIQFVLYINLEWSTPYFYHWDHRDGWGALPFLFVPALVSVTAKSDALVATHRVSALIRIQSQLPQLIRGKEDIGMRNRKSIILSVRISVVIFSLYNIIPLISSKNIYKKNHINLLILLLW